MLRELKDTEKTLAAAEYCARPAVHAQGSVPALDPARAILPDDLNIVLDSAAVSAVSGWCMLPDGASYLTVRRTLPGVTRDMLQWAVAWHGLEPVNHMAFNGETHHSAGVSALDEEKIRRPYLSHEQKSEGIIVYTVDSIGGTLTENVTYYYSPADQGLDLDRYARSGALTIGGTVIRQEHAVTDPQKKWLNAVITVVRDTADGVEVQTHLWEGYKILRREARRFDVNGIQPTPEHTQMLADYIDSEWTQLGAILPELYARFGDTI